MREESPVKSALSNLGYLDRFRRYSRSKSEVVRNHAVFGSNFFGGRPAEFLDLHYKAHPYSDHVAKFHGDRPRELGDRVAKKIKRNISSKT